MGKKAFQFTPSQITLETCGDCQAVPHCRQIKMILDRQRIRFRCPVKPGQRWEERFPVHNTYDYEKKYDEIGIYMPRT